MVNVPSVPELRRRIRCWANDLIRRELANDLTNDIDADGDDDSGGSAG
jgi:hypothetical protein